MFCLLFNWKIGIKTMTSDLLLCVVKLPFLPFPFNPIVSRVSDGGKAMGVELGPVVILVVPGHFPPGVEGLLKFQQPFIPVPVGAKKQNNIRERLLYRCSPSTAYLT